jgi:flagellar assembly factor FliW
LEIATRHFGNVEIDENKIMIFKEGIFGFEDQKEFIVLYDGEEDDNPFAWLQAIKDKDICLPMVNPMAWYPSYSPDVDDEKLASIGDLDETALDVYTIVVIPDDIKDMTTNLRAPIIFNKETRNGIQVIVKDDEYDIKHNLYEQLEKLKKAGE